MTTAEVASVVRSLLATQPRFHSGGTRVWSATPRTLELLATHVADDDSSVETGAGASTVVLAAAGARHTAISPFGDEHQRIRAYLESEGIQDDKITFIEGSSDTVLPSLPGDATFDFAFIDGKHSFPYPVVDFHLIDRRLKVGGKLLIDDIPIPAVNVVFRFLDESSDWRLLDIADNRAALFLKLADAEDEDNWHLQPANAGYPDYSFAPLEKRLRLQAAHSAQVFKRRLGDRVPVLRRLRNVRGRIQKGFDDPGGH